MKDKDKNDIILSRAIDEAATFDIPGFTERFQNFVRYAQSVGYYDKIREIIRRAQAAGSSSSREIEAARASGELPTVWDLEAQMHSSKGTIN